MIASSFIANELKMIMLTNALLILLIKCKLYTRIYRSKYVGKGFVVHLCACPDNRVCIKKQVRSTSLERSAQVLHIKKRTSSYNIDTFY